MNQRGVSVLVSSGVLILAYIVVIQPRRGEIPSWRQREGALWKRKRLDYEVILELGAVRSRPALTPGAQKPAPGEITVVRIPDVGEFGGLRFGAARSSLEGNLKDETTYVSAMVSQQVGRQNYLKFDAGQESRVKWCQREDAPAEVDGIRVAGVYYGFADKKFVEAVVVPAPEEAERMLAALKRRYPGGKRRYDNWIWLGQRVGIDFVGERGNESAAPKFVGIFPAERVLRPKTIMYSIIH